MSPVHDAYSKKVSQFALTLCIVININSIVHGLLPASHHWAKARLATQASIWIYVSEWETQQEGWSRTAVSPKFVSLYSHINKH
jgi:hypothetical protein